MIQNGVIITTTPIIQMIHSVIKKELVRTFLQSTQGKTVWDLGANDGTFTSISNELGMYGIAFDIDPIAVNKNYLREKKNGNKAMLPLLMDLTNPSSGLGWAHSERDSLASRGKADCLMALALIHHLAISNNVPFELLSSYFAELGKELIIEFVPKSDSKVQILLASREDIFSTYDEEGFESCIQ